MKKLLIALGLVASFSAHAEWSTTFDSDTQIDLSYSKKLTNDLIAVWHKTSFVKHNSSNYFVSLAQYNCKEKTYRLISYTSYTNGQADIYGSFKKDYATTPFEDVEPGTYNAKKMVHACQNVK